MIVSLFKSTNKFVNKYGTKFCNSVNKPEKAGELLNTIGDTVEFPGKPAAKVCKSAKEIITDSIGGNIKLTKDFQDLGNFYSFKTFFKKPTQHYIYIDKDKSTKWTTYTGGHVSCHYDLMGELEKFFVFDSAAKSIREFNKLGGLVKQYTPEEALAMLKYKSSSTEIHKLLRGKQQVKNQEEVEKVINNLTQIFENGKASVASEDIIAYRALDKHSLDAILNMEHDGMIFNDPSFVSVATKKSSVYPFLNLKNMNHIMQVKIPKGSKYINLDEVGHIVVPQKAENELLLKGDLLIKNRDGRIIAEYIGR